MPNRTARITKIALATALLIGIFGSVFTSRTYAEGVAITSPANGQEFSSNNLTVTGTSDPNATVLIINNRLTIAKTKADGNGQWSAQLTGLPNGSNTITARSITNTGFAYYGSSDDQGQTIKINQFKFSDRSINASPYPIAATTAQFFFSASPVDNILYHVGNFFTPNVPPAKFDADNPAAPQAVAGYPDTTYVGLGAFSPDGTKYFSPNPSIGTISVVDVASNTIADTLNIGTAFSVWLSPSGKIFATHETNDVNMVSRINPETNAVELTTDINEHCVNGVDSGAVMVFSQDEAFPYYYIPCNKNNATDTDMQKYRIDTNEFVSSTIVNKKVTSAVMSLDNKFIYTSSSCIINGNTDSQNVHVFNVATGNLDKTISLTAGALGIFQSPDGQYLYIATPGVTFAETGFDILNTDTDTIEHIDTGANVIPAITASFRSATTADVNVSFVLGVATASATPASQLAKTGVFVALATPVGLFLVAATLYTYLDYRKHKTPLTEASSDVNYSYFHHLKVVSLPLAKYRLSIGVDRQVGDRSDRVRRF